MKITQKPIYVVLGTRAQLIKTAPLLKVLDERKIEYKFIYTAQHSENISEISEDFKLKKPDFTVKINDEAKSIKLFASWFLRVSYLLFFKRKMIVPTPGLLITHGDTTTCVWAALLGKLSSCQVMHLESGLRSYNLLNPFPEEINRLITFRLTNIFVCPNDVAIANVDGYKGIKLNTKFNTLYDSVSMALKKNDNLPIRVKKPYVVVSIHRFENIFNLKRFKSIIKIIRKIANDFKVIFVLHPATKKQIRKFNLMDQFEDKNINLVNRVSFFEFIALSRNSEFVVTDGGSNQEELSYLGKPTLILRSVTERNEGLSRNALLSNFRVEIIDNFVRDYKKYQYPGIKIDISPSNLIADWIEDKYE